MTDEAAPEETVAEAAELAAEEELGAEEAAAIDAELASEGAEPAEAAEAEPTSPNGTPAAVPAVATAAPAAVAAPTSAAGGPAARSAGDWCSNEQGTVKWFNDAKGYGFIVRERGGDVFVHHASILAEGFRTLSEGDRVRFCVVQGPKGLQAKNVIKIN